MRIALLLAGLFLASVPCAAQDTEPHFLVFGGATYLNNGGAAGGFFYRPIKSKWDFGLELSGWSLGDSSPLVDPSNPGTIHTNTAHATIKAAAVEAIYRQEQGRLGEFPVFILAGAGLQEIYSREETNVGANRDFHRKERWLTAPLAELGASIVAADRVELVLLGKYVATSAKVAFTDKKYGGAGFTARLQVRLF